MAQREFDYAKIAELYKSMQEITGDAGSPESIAGLLELANKDMAEMCGVQEEALYGPLADQLTMDWQNFSSNFPNFVANFHNWATVVSNASGQYQEFEDRVKGLKDANPLGYASDGRTMNYIADSPYQQYAEANLAQYQEDLVALESAGLYELTAAEYTFSGVDSRLRKAKIWGGVVIGTMAAGAAVTAVGAGSVIAGNAGVGVNFLAKGATDEALAAAGYTRTAEGLIVKAGSEAAAAAAEGAATTAAEGATQTAAEGATQTAVDQTVAQTGTTVARQSVSTASQLTLEDGRIAVQNSAGRWVIQAGQEGGGKFVSNAAIEAARNTAATTAEQTVANATRLTLSNGTNIVQNSAGRWVIEAGQQGGGKFVTNAAVEEAKNIAYNNALSGLTGGTTQAAASTAGNVAANAAGNVAANAAPAAGNVAANAAPAAGNVAANAAANSTPVVEAAANATGRTISGTARALGSRAWSGIRTTGSTLANTGRRLMGTRMGRRVLTGGALAAGGMAAATYLRKH